MASERLDWSSLPDVIEGLDLIASRLEEADVECIDNAKAFLIYQLRHKRQQQRYHKKMNIQRKITEQELEKVLTPEELADIDRQAEKMVDE